MGWPNFRFCFTFSNLSPAIGACLAAATKYDESNDKSFRTSEFLVNESVCLKLGITVYLSHDFNIQTFQYSCLFVFGKQYSLVLLTHLPSVFVILFVFGVVFAVVFVFLVVEQHLVFVLYSYLYFSLENIVR